jgi:hypothetical protein
VFLLPQTEILPISTSQVAGITVMYHYAWECIICFISYKDPQLSVALSFRDFGLLLLSNTRVVETLGKESVHFQLHNSYMMLGEIMTLVLSLFGG